ncbi:hypothetical protein ACGFYV_19115 [Streptomyces sp. NPDC048297]|uniref:hypothetical protein n=1 Tax=Streptomyces sp. NPDC048297 TaxID=3365531 RepID=UPI0037164724
MILGSFHDAKVAPQSPMARLGTALPRLSPRRPFLAQLEEAAAAQPSSAELRDLRTTITSRPGESAVLLRRLFYRWLDLPEPVAPARPRLVPVPSAVPVGSTSPVQRPVYVSAAPDGGRITVRRYAAPLQRRTRERHLAGTHLVADIDDPDATWPRSADVLLLPLGRPSRTEATAIRDAVAARYPGCGLIAIEEPDDACVVLLRDGGRLHARWHGGRPSWASAAIAASVVHDHAVPMAGAPGPVRLQVTIGPDSGTGLLAIAPL